MHGYSCVCVCARGGGTTLASPAMAGTIIVQAFYHKCWANLTQIATKLSKQFLAEKKHTKSPKESHGGKYDQCH